MRFVVRIDRTPYNGRRSTQSPFRAIGLMQELHHECGIAAIYHLESPTPSKLVAKDGPEQVARLMVRMLIDLQNRGQLATGMTSFNPHRESVLDTYKQIGTVIEAFRLNHPAKFENILR